MSTFKKCKVVMLPTNEKANLYLHETKGLHLLAAVEHKSGSYSGSNQHLYFLSDEEIKEGDWFVMNGCIIRQCSLHKGDVLDTMGGLHHESVCKKIIATTDKSLMYLESDYSCYLPQIPQSFIEKFVEEYNKGNVITEVMVEYEPIGAYSNPKYDSDYRLKVNSKDNTITIRKIKDSWSREEVEKLCREARYTTGVVEIDKWIEKNL